MDFVNSITILIDLDDRLRTVLCAYDDPTRKEQFNHEIQDHFLHKTMNVKMQAEFPMWSSNLLVMHLVNFIETVIKNDMGLENFSDCITNINLRSSVQVEVTFDGRQYRKPSFATASNFKTRFQ